MALPQGTTQALPACLGFSWRSVVHWMTCAVLDGVDGPDNFIEDFA
jgi:hypothetical protein